MLQICHPKHQVGQPKHQEYNLNWKLMFLKECEFNSWRNIPILIDTILLLSKWFIESKSQYLVRTWKFQIKYYLSISMFNKLFFLVQNNWYLKQIHRGGWPGFGMAWSWDGSQLIPTDLGWIPTYCLSIPTLSQLRGVVQFCQIFQDVIFHTRRCSEEKLSAAGTGQVRFPDQLAFWWYIYAYLWGRALVQAMTGQTRGETLFRARLANLRTA